MIISKIRILLILRLEALQFTTNSSCDSRTCRFHDNRRILTVMNGCRIPFYDISLLTHINDSGQNCVTDARFSGDDALVVDGSYDTVMSSTSCNVTQIHGNELHMLQLLTGISMYET